MIKNYSFHFSRTGITAVLIMLIAACTCMASCTTSLPAESALPTESTRPAQSTLVTESAFSSESIFDPDEDEPSAPPVHQLAFLSNKDGAVIFGGENSPYYVDGIFEYTDVDSMWSPMTSQTFHLTEAVNNIAYSIDKTSVAFIEGENKYFTGESSKPQTRTLMYFDGVEAVSIASGVGYFCISSNGNAVAYISGSILYVYDCISGESRQICENAGGSIALSPDGQSISYTSASNADSTCYVMITGGKPEEIGSSCDPVALTDDGSIIYYYDYRGDQLRFCVRHEGITEVLIQDVSRETDTLYTADLVFNSSCTQVIYRVIQDFYFSMNGGKPVKVTGGDVVDRNSKYYVNDSFVRLMQVDGQTISPYFVDNRNLCNLLFSSGTALTYFDENLVVHTFSISEYMEGILSEDGTALLYGTYDFDVYPNKYTYTFLSDYTDPACSPIVLKDNYIRFAILTSNNTIYYSNDVGQLFMIRGSEPPRKIDTYVWDVYTMDINGSSYVYYLKDQKKEDSTYTLCRIEDVPDAEPVVIDPDTADVDVCDAGLVYYKNVLRQLPDSITRDVYFAADGRHGEFVFTLYSGMNY